MDPNFRRMGIASRLIAMMMKMAKARGYKRLELRTHSSNTQGIAFYRKNGFEWSGESVFTNFFHIEFEVVQMTLPLDNEPNGTNKIETHA